MDICLSYLQKVVDASLYAFCAGSELLLANCEKLRSKENPVNHVWTAFGALSKAARLPQGTPAVVGILYVDAHFVEDGGMLLFQGDCLRLPRRGAGGAGNRHSSVAMSC